MGNIFTPIGETRMPNAVSNPDNTKVNYNTGKFFDRVNNIKRPSPESVNKAPSKGGFFNLDTFYSSIGKQESGNNYGAKGGMLLKGSHAGTRALGKYQFMPKTLKGLGYNVSSQEFLTNKNLQEQAMQKLTAQNAKGLGIQDTAKMTQRQFKALSMAHYSGLGNARKFLKGGLTSTHLKTQTGTGSSAPSIGGYADSVTQHAGNYMKSGEVNKAQETFNKLKLISKGDGYGS